MVYCSVHTVGIGNPAVLNPSFFRSVRLMERSKPFRPVTHLDLAANTFRHGRPLLESVKSEPENRRYAKRRHRWDDHRSVARQACLASNPFVARLPVENGHCSPLPSKMAGGTGFQSRLVVVHQPQSWFPGTAQCYPINRFTSKSFPSRNMK